MALAGAVGSVGAAVLLARHWPGEGTRDAAALALCGFLLRRQRRYGWDEARVDAFARLVARLAGDEEWRQRGKATNAAERLAKGEPVMGLPSLAGLLVDGPAVVSKLVKWLGEEEQVSEDFNSCPASATRASVRERARVDVKGTSWRDAGTRPSDAQVLAQPSEETIVKTGRGVLAADVTEQRLTWLWQGRIPLGKLTLLDGDPGLGKSLITLDLAARVTTGREMPDGTLGVDGGVVLLSAEDDVAATIRPRLAAAGADLSRIYILQTVHVSDTQTKRQVERAVVLPDDAAVVQEAVARMGARLIVIDPLMAYLDAKVNSWRDQDVRAALTPLAQLAEQSSAALLVLRHLTKGSSSNAIYRGGGSIGIIGAARSGLLVAKDPDDPEQCRVLASAKSNLGPPMPSLRYCLAADDDQRVRVEWLGASEQTATALLAQSIADDNPSELDEAMEWLTELLRDSAKPSEEIERLALARGIPKKRLRTASERLRLDKVRSGRRADHHSLWGLHGTLLPPEAQGGSAAFAQLVPLISTHAPSSAEARVAPEGHEYTNAADAADDAVVAALQQRGFTLANVRLVPPPVQGDREPSAGGQ